MESTNKPDPKKLRIVSYFCHDAAQDTEFAVFVYQSPASSATARQYMEEFLKAINADYSLYTEFQHLYGIWADNTGLRKIGSKNFHISANASKYPSCSIKFKRTQADQGVGWQKLLADRLAGRAEYQEGQWFVQTNWTGSNISGAQDVLDHLTALTPELEVDLRQLEG